MKAAMPTPHKPRRLDARSPFVFDARELGRRPGAMQQFDRDIPAAELLGVKPSGGAGGGGNGSGSASGNGNGTGGGKSEAKQTEQPASTLDGLYTAEGADLLLDLRIESVVEGVLTTGRVSGSLVAECVRCLEPVEVEVDADFQELFYYDREDLSAEEAEEAQFVVDDLLSVRELVHDALMLELPLQPLCEEDCPGLCAECGAVLAEEPDHRHETTDPRWAVLQGLDLGAGSSSQSAER
jgi:uncharacterized protein